MQAAGKRTNVLASLRSTGCLISFLGCRSACCNASPCAALGPLPQTRQSRASHQLNCRKCSLTGLAPLTNVCTGVAVVACSSHLASGSPGSVTAAQTCGTAPSVQTLAAASGFLPPFTVGDKQLMALVRAEGLSSGREGPGVSPPQFCNWVSSTAQISCSLCSEEIASK